MGKPVHYVRAIGGGAAAALLGGFVLAQVLVAVGFMLLILSALLGFLAGKVVGWGARRQSQRPFRVIAAACGVLVVLVAGLVAFATPLPPNPWFLLAYPVAGWFGLRGLQW
ncbi:MAG: hypothetical protein M3O70_20110 [Actinomycetota bacterium]|nr:hypothetical protein [Actinomycetota bacterium]